MEQRDDARETASAYLDGELTPEERVAFERRLAASAETRRALDEQRATRALLRALPTPAAPRSFLLPITDETEDLEPEEPARLPAPARIHRARRGSFERVATWLGSVAASLGLLLLLSSAVISSGHGSQSAASRSAAPATSHSGAQHGQTGGEGAPTGTAQGEAQPSFEPVATTAPTATAAPAPNAPTPTSASASALPALPLAGAGLLVGGATLLATGAATGRRRRARPGAS